MIKGTPAVHDDDDLIVSHIALTVTGKDGMAGLRRRLSELGVTSRKNVSVPNPALGKAVDQAFVRDPDGLVTVNIFKTAHKRSCLKNRHTT